MDKKLIYILPRYSHKSTEHFYHTINLLKSIADKGVKIALVIIECDKMPDEVHENIMIIYPNQENRFKRRSDMFFILRRLIKDGYRKIFTRVSTQAAIFSILLAKIYGAETYYWQSGTTYEVDKDKTFFKKINWYIKDYSKMWFIKTFVDFFVTGPETMIEYYIKNFKIKQKKMLLLYNDIDTNRFLVPSKDEKKEAKRQLGFSENKKMILMVHRLSPVRKTDYYIPFIAETKQLIDEKINFVIIGDGPEMPTIKKLLNNSIAKNNVFLLGSKPNNEIQEYYRAADVFIMPSFTEGFPRVLIEAMACGLPVVGTNAGGTMDLVGDMQKMFIVDKRDRVAFREMLFELITDEVALEKLSKENIKQVKRYSTEVISDMYIERIFKNG